MVDLTFHDRTVIVTGAGNGLGRAHALELGRRGANVVVNDLGGSTSGEGASKRAADFVVAEITDAGGRAAASYDSVATVEGCEAMAALAIERFGRIDAVVHNAGILRNAMFDDMTDERFFPVLATHLIGAFYLSRAVYPTMRAQEYGRFVFTSSASGAWGRPNGANYNAAKAGVLGLCNAISLEGAEHGILANAILPVGFTRLAGAPEAADQSESAHDARRASANERPRSLPEWVTPMVVYLASEACDRTHRYYSSVEGRYARVAVVVAKGWREPGEEPPSAETIYEHLDQIEDLAVYDLPDSVFHEIELARERWA